MKHIKTYNEVVSHEYKIFESSDTGESIVNDIMDMSLDIQDDGFLIKDQGGRGSFSISVCKPVSVGYGIEEFSISEIEDFIFRINEYSKTSPYKIEMWVPCKTGSNNWGSRAHNELFIRDNNISVIFRHGHTNYIKDDYLIINKVGYVEIKIKA